MSNENIKKIQDENIKKIQDSIKAQNLSYKINLAGILYNLNYENDISYLSRGIRSFLKDFQKITLNNKNTNPLKPMSNNTKKALKKLNFDHNVISIHYILYILTKYFNPEISKKTMLKMIKSDQCENEILTIILKERARKIYNTIRFNNERYNGHITNHRVVANIPYEKSHRAILTLIEDIADIDVHVFNETSKKLITNLVDLNEYYIIESILELAWFLEHPEASAIDALSFWSKKVKELDKIRIIDIIYMIKEKSTIFKLPHDVNKLDNIMENRLLMMLHILCLQRLNKKTRPKEICGDTRINKYEGNSDGEGDEGDGKEDEGDGKVEGDKADGKEDEGDADEGEGEENKNSENKIILRQKKELNKLTSEQKVRNLQKSRVNRFTDKMRAKFAGGGSKLHMFNKPIDSAMSPIFDKCKSLYDPIYSFLQKSVTTYTKGDSHNTKTNVIPLLLTLHHICSNIREHGMYRIININNDIVLFINHIITHTENNTNKKINKQLLTLPKVYLSTLFNKSSTYKPPTSIPYVQLFTYENNLNIQPNDLTKNTEINNELKSFFNKKDVYILNTQSSQLNKNIPIALYEIDFSKIDLYTPNIKINKLENNFLNTKTPDLFLDNLISLKNVTFNNAELALSIFIAFKEII